MSIEELGDLVGISVTLNTSISNKRYRARIIGYNKGKSLIISQPVSLSDDADLLVGEEVVVRFLAKEKACAFKAGVIHMSSTPYPYMHLTYPRKFQFESYRSYIRLKTKDLGASLLIPEQDPINAIVSDISMGGLQLLCRSPELVDNLELKIGFVLPQQSIKEPIFLPVAIRNCRPMKGDYDLYGLEFVNLNADDISKLQQLLGYCISIPVDS